MPTCSQLAHRFACLRRGERFYAEDGLTDLRLVTEGGRPVPHLLIHPPSPEREWIRGSILGVAATKKNSGFEVDLGTASAVDMIRVDGLPVPYLKRLTLEGSGDRERWTMLVAEGTLFDLPDEQLRQNALGFAAGPYRYSARHLERCQQRARPESECRCREARFDGAPAARDHASAHRSSGVRANRG